MEEAEEEVEAVVVGSEEDGDEVVAEDSKNWVEWVVASLIIIISVMRIGHEFGRKRLILRLFATLGYGLGNEPRERVQCMHSLWGYWRFEWHMRSS